MKNIGVAVIGLGGIGTLRAHSCAQIPQVGHLATAEHARAVLALTMAADRSCKENKPIRI
jgi:hypothetical protein